MIDKDKVIQLAKEAGAARFYPEAQSAKPDAYLVGQEFIERFAQAIYRQGLEDAARLFGGQPYMEHFGREIADAIRSLKESTNG